MQDAEQTLRDREPDPHHDDRQQDERVLRWERRTEWPLLAASLVFLAAYAVPIIDTTLSPAARHAWHRLSDAMWLLFGIDYVARLAMSRRRLRFVRKNWLDLFILLLPMLRPLRVLRVVTAMQQLHRQVRLGLRSRVLAYAGLTTLLLGLTASLAELEAERGQPGATIQDFEDALWWAFTTITTVGYGDTHPVTTQGRLVALLLMAGGVALLGVVTGSFSSWFVSRFETREESEERTQALVHQLHADVRALRAELAAERNGNSGSGNGGAPERG